MPRLLAARFESVGHRDARLDGLTLRFIGHDSKPSDSVLWLRNGGGKSSVLNLIFSVIRPSQREFLGSEADAGIRELAHYIFPEETAVVCLGWELEKKEGKEPSHLITGVSMQLNSSDQRIRRLFYAIKIKNPEKSFISIDTLPIVFEKDGRRYVRKISSLKETLAELSKKPGVSLYMTEIQREWTSRLVRYNIDPEVFGYQLKMNRSEGVADEIFRFKSDEAFSDFVIEMVLPPDGAHQVSENLKDLRSRVAERPKLEKERDALDRAEKVLEPALSIYEKKQEKQKELVESVRDLVLIDSTIEDLLVKREERVKIGEDEALAQDEIYRSSELKSRENTCASIVFKNLLLKRTFGQRKEEEQEVSASIKNLEQQVQLISAAEIFEELDKTRNEISLLKEKLEKDLSGSKPLLSDLRRSAWVFLCSLDNNLDKIKKQLKNLDKKEKKSGIEKQESIEAINKISISLAKIDEKLAGLQAFVEKAGEQRSGLEKKGFLKDAEEPEVAINRWSETHDQVKKVRKILSSEINDLDEEHIKAYERKFVVEQRARSNQEFCEVLKDTVQKARDDYKNLAENQTLHDVLEDNSPDLISLGSEAVSRITHHNNSLEAQLFDLQIEYQQEKRRLDWLTRYELLPPSMGAERLRDFLEQRGIQAWPGGLFLSLQFREKRARQIVENNPDVLSQVVVSDDDFDQVQEIFKKEDFSYPVVVTKISEFESTDLSLSKILVSNSELYWNKKNIRKELKQRESALKAKERKIEEKTMEKKVLEQCIFVLKELNRKYSRSWFDGKNEELKERLVLRSSDEKESQVIKRELSEKIEEIRLKKQRLAECDIEISKAEKALVELEIMCDSVELSKCEREIEDLERKKLSEGEKLEERREAVEKLSNDIVKLQEKRVELSTMKNILDRERLEVRPDCDRTRKRKKKIEDLESARKSYLLSKQIYEQNMTEDTVKGRLIALESQAQHLEEKFNTLLGRIKATQQDVFEFVNKKSDFDGLDEFQSDIEKRLEESRMNMSEIRSSLILDQRALEEQKREFDTLAKQKNKKFIEKYKKIGEDYSIQCLEEEIKKSEELSVQNYEDQQRAYLARDQARAEAESARKDIERLGDWSRRIEDTKGSLPRNDEVQAVFDLEKDNTEKDRGIYHENIESISEFLDRSVKTVREMTKSLRSVEEEARKRARLLESFAIDPDSAVLPEVLRDRFREKNVDILLSRTSDLLDDVRIRAGNLLLELDQVNKHRTIIATSMERATDGALEILNSLEQASIFPGDVRAWGGNPFLKVKMSTPKTAAERKLIAEELIDRIVQQREIPSGLKLVQTLIRELVKHGALQIQMLKPDVHRRLDYVPISKLGAFSGGERLTAAILIYCTLSQMRAQRRGAASAPTSVLVLDNPVGACSHPELLELQRDMARSHGVQLVYTTGVEDLEALGRLPNILRLKNAHSDVRGRRRVTLDAQPIEVARVARTDENIEESKEKDDLGMIAA